MSCGKRKCPDKRKDETSKYFKKVESETTNDEPFPDNSSKTSSLLKNDQIQSSLKTNSTSDDKTSGKLGPEFFNVPCVQLARALLGQVLVRKIGSERLAGIIVETEAYLGVEDKAAHSYKGKMTDRTKAMFMTPGTAYVYNIYGMYCCLNISSQGDGCAVLLRSLEPTEGLDFMKKTRSKNLKSSKSKKDFKDKELTNGPSKLCQALDVSKSSMNQVDLTNTDLAWLERGTTVEDEFVVTSPRINIGYAEEWVEKPLRFYILANPYVSQRNKPAEEALKKKFAKITKKS